jgi:hypothetical protein
MDMGSKDHGLFCDPRIYLQVLLKIVNHSGDRKVENALVMSADCK